MCSGNVIGAAIRKENFSLFIELIKYRLTNENDRMNNERMNGLFQNSIKVLSYG